MTTGSGRAVLPPVGEQFRYSRFHHGAGQRIVSGVERDKAIEGMHKQSDSLVRLFEQNTEDLVSRLDRTLLLLRRSYEDDPERFDLRSWATRVPLLGDETLDLALAGADGFETASTTDQIGPRPYVGDHDYFVEQMDPGRDQLFISGLVRQAAKSSIKFSRRLRRHDGQFGGIIALSLNPDFIERFFRTVDLGQHCMIILRNLDGVVLAAEGSVGDAIGQRINPPPYLEALAKSRIGYYWGGGAVDGYNRLVAYRASGKYPMVFAVGLAESEALTGYQVRRASYFFAAGTTTLLILILIVFQCFRQLKFDEARERLKMLNQEMAAQNILFDATVRNVPNGLSMFDGDGRLMVWNDQYVEIYRMSPVLIKRGVSIKTIVEHRKQAGNIDSEVDDYIAAFRKELIENGRQISIATLTDGRSISVVNTAIAGGGWVATHEDITDRKRALAAIGHMARHDPLTGLANRTEFNEKLSEACKRVKRMGTGVTVLMLDLDKFKAVNDTLGHPAGDQLLLEVGRRLRSMLRETDVLVRLGGDEFAVIQEAALQQTDGAETLAHRIIDTIGQPFDLDGRPATIGVSIGIAMAPEHGIDPEPLMTAADLALYEVKAEGRNDFRIFRPTMLEVARTEKLAESELREAIARDQLELHYQPVIDARRYQLAGVEALVRWRHPTRGLVPPDLFIPLAERTGLIVPLGEWVLRRACLDAASLPDHVKVAVNVSAVQFRNGGLYDAVVRILHDTGFAPNRLELEITETSYLDEKQSYLAAMRQLKEIGIAMVLDDFGTGYSSINYLIRFPIDKIKIDKSFTQGVLERQDCAAVIASTLALSQGLGLLTTAEGVEEVAQFEYVRNAGVDLVQGYLFGKPVPMAEFGPQAARTLETLGRLTRPPHQASLRKLEGSKLGA